MEQIHLTLLQYHLQEQQSRKPTTSWGPGAVLARVKTGESCEPFKGAGTMLQTRLFAFMHHGRGIKTPHPAPPQAGRQRARSSRDADQAPTEQKGIQCKAERSAKKKKKKKKQRRRNSSSFMDMYFWEENARYDSQKQRAPCSHWNQHLPGTVEIPWRITLLHTTWVVW